MRFTSAERVLRFARRFPQIELQLRKKNVRVSNAEGTGEHVTTDESMLGPLPHNINVNPRTDTGSGPP